MDVAIKRISFENDRDGVPHSALREVTNLRGLGAHPCVVSLIDVVYLRRSVSRVRVTEMQLHIVFHSPISHRIPRAYFSDSLYGF